MDSMKVTSGKWVVKQGSDYTQVGTYTDDEFYPLANIVEEETYDADIDVAEAEANAHFMAASKILYWELNHLVTLLEPLESNGNLNVPGLATLNGARAAIAKAKGN